MKRANPTPQLCGIVMGNYLIGPFSCIERARSYRDKYCGKVNGRKARVMPMLLVPPTAYNDPV
jgi:hypothetical protein